MPCREEYMKKISRKELEGVLEFAFPLCVFLMLALALVYGCLVSFQNDLASFPPNWIINIGIDMLGMIVCLILLYSCILEMTYAGVNKAFMRLLCVICLNLFWDMLAWNYDGVEGFQQIVRFVNTCYFLTGFVVQYNYWAYIEAELKLTGYGAFRYMNLFASIFGCTTTVYNWFNPFYFDVGTDAVYERSDFYLLCFVPAVVVFVTAAIAVIRQKISGIEKMALLSYEVFPFCAVLFQTINYGLSILYPACLLGVLLVYSNIYTQRSRKIAEQQAKITEQNMSIMVSQIQPHFLYNTLTTISNLIRKDPDEAEEATVLFSQYLRGNLDSLRKKETVPFQAELNHVKTYLTLEQMRFGDKLQVVYDVKEEHFRIPALSLQPIVENSVKHGICEKEDTGTLTISTRADRGGYLIVVEDDGVGFDPTVPKADDGRSHVGMQNVIDRLDSMCGAKMRVISSPGNGCRTEIWVPVRK